MDSSTVSGVIELYEIEDDSLKEFPNENVTKINLDWNKDKDILEKDFANFLREKRFQEDITEEEKNILEEKVRLEDGSLGDIITCFKNGDVWFYYCHPCSEESQGWERLEIHLKNKTHKVMLSKASHAKNKFIAVYKNDNLSADKTDSDLAPCNIQPKVDECVKHLVGLEYLVESDIGFTGFAKAPQYYCLLCDKLGNDRNIFTHLASKHHYLKFLLMFFPTALEKIKQFATIHSKSQDLVYAVIEHVVARIETDYGRLKPIQVERDSFDRLKFKILLEIDQGKHFRETKEKTFEECVCLTHLHLSVCRVIPYQEKWIPLENRETQQSEETIDKKNSSNLLKPNMQIGVDTPQNHPLKESQHFGPLEVENLSSSKNVNVSALNLSSRSDTGINLQTTQSVRNIQDKVGSIQNISLHSRNVSADFQNDSKRNWGRKRSILSSELDGMNKRINLTQGISYTQTQASTNQVLSNVWKSSDSNYFNQIMKSTHLSTLVKTNFIPVNNNVKIPIVNTTIRTPSVVKTKMHHLIPQTTRINHTASTFVQNITSNNVQQQQTNYHLYSNQANNMHPLINQVQRSSTSSSSNGKIIKTMTNKNIQQIFPRKNTMIPSPLNSINLGNGTHFNNSGNTIQNSSNLNMFKRQEKHNVSSANLFFPQMMTKNHNSVTISQNSLNQTTFNKIQPSNRLLPQILNNSSNNHLNPIAFSVPPPAPPPMMSVSSQRLNLPLQNQFNQ